MNPQRSFSAPHGNHRLQLQSHTGAPPGRSRRQRTPHAQQRPPSSNRQREAARQREVVWFDRYPVLPPLGQQQGQPGAMATVHPPHSTLHPPNPPPLQAPALVQTLVPTYPQVPLSAVYPSLPLPLYPPAPYPPVPYGVPSMVVAGHPLPYAPYGMTAQHLYTQPFSPQITEIHHSTNRSEDAEQGVYQQSPSPHLLLSFCEEACEDLVASCVSDMIRETVNSCIEDIVRSYVAQSQRLVEMSKSTRRVSRTKSSLRPRSNPVWASGGAGPVRVKEEEGGGEGGSMLKRKGWWYQDLEGRHSELLQMDSSTEVTHRMCTMLLDELIFSQLLEASLDGTWSMAVRTQAHQLLSGLILEGLLGKLCTQTP